MPTASGTGIEHEPIGVAGEHALEPETGIVAFRLVWQTVRRAHGQVVEADPDPGDAGAVVLREALPGGVHHDDDAAPVEQGDLLWHGVEDLLRPHVGLDELGHVDEAHDDPLRGGWGHEGGHQPDQHAAPVGHHDRALAHLGGLQRASHILEEPFAAEVRRQVLDGAPDVAVELVHVLRDRGRERPNRELIVEQQCAHVGAAEDVVDVVVRLLELPDVTRVRRCTPLTASSSSLVACSSS